LFFINGISSAAIWERELLAIFKNDGTTLFVFGQKRAVLEVTDQIVFALDSCIGNFAHFFGIESFPFFVVEFFIESNNRLRIKKIDKCISNVALIFEIDWQIEKVVRSFVGFIDGCQKHFLRIFVWNVFDHESCACIFLVSNF